MRAACICVCISSLGGEGVFVCVYVCDCVPVLFCFLIEGEEACIFIKSVVSEKEREKV